MRTEIYPGIRTDLRGSYHRGSIPTVGISHFQHEHFFLDSLLLHASTMRIANMRALSHILRPVPRRFNRPFYPTFRNLATVGPTPPRVDATQSADNQTVAAMGRTSSGKELKIRKYPTFERKEDERLYRKQHLAAAYRVFAERGFDEGVAGHISVRDPVWEDHFCKYDLYRDFEMRKWIW